MPRLAGNQLFGSLRRRESRRFHDHHLRTSGSILENESAIVVSTGRAARLLECDRRAGNTGFVNATHRYGDDGGYAIVITVDDTQGGIATANVAATLDNVAPAVNAGFDQQVFEGATVSLGPATYQDPGSRDTHTSEVNWGESSTAEMCFSILFRYPALGGTGRCED